MEHVYLGAEHASEDVLAACAKVEGKPELQKNDERGSPMTLCDFHL